MNFLPKQYFHPPFTPPYLLHLTKREQYSAKTGQYFAFPLCFSAKYLLLHHSKPLDKTNYVQALIPSHINPFQPLIPQCSCWKILFPTFGSEKQTVSKFRSLYHPRQKRIHVVRHQRRTKPLWRIQFPYFSKHNHSNPHSLGNNNVNSLHENKDGEIMDRNRRRNLYLWSIDGNFLKTHLQKSGQLVHHPAHCTNHHRYTKKHLDSSRIPKAFSCSITTDKH